MKEKYAYGQLMIAREEAKKQGKPDIAYIVTHTGEDDILIKMSGVFPYTVGKDHHFFVHIEKLPLLWDHPDEGIQVGMFGVKQEKTKKRKHKKKIFITNEQKRKKRN